MRIDFTKIEERRAPGMNGGTGEMSARMYMDEGGKIIPCRIHAGGSIGLHTHQTSDDINFILSGTGIAVCDGVEEVLAPWYLSCLQKRLSAQHYQYRER